MFWALLIVCEVVFWLLLGAFAFARYWYGRYRASRWFLVAIVFNQLWLVPVAVWDARAFERFSVLHADAIIEAVALPLILLFARRRFIQKLDRGAESYVGRVREISDERGTNVPQAAFTAAVRTLQGHDTERNGTASSGEVGEDARDLAHARKERRGWYVHLAIFIAVQGLLQLAFFIGLLEPTDGLFFGDGPRSPIQIGPIEFMPDIAGMRRVWAMILLVDFIWSFSYTLWPKRLPGKASQSSNEGRGR